jgi:hypothetical protein
LSAEAFFNKVKSMAVTLVAIGQPLCDTEFMCFVLSGLDEDYDGLVEAVTSREDPMTP